MVQTMISRQRLRGAVGRGPVAVAVGSALTVLAASFLLAGISRSWVVFAVAQTIFAFTPDAFVTFGIQNLGDLSQPLLVVGAVATATALFASAALGVLALADAAGRARAETVFAVGVVQTLLGFALTVSPLPSLAGGVAGALVVGLAGVETTTDEVERRGLLRSLGAAGVTLGLGGTLAGYRVSRLSGNGSGQNSDESDRDPAVATLLDTAEERSLAVSGVEGLVSDSFYQVDINTVDPQVNWQEWSLSITGEVDEEVSVSLSELLEYDAEHRFVTLRCVGDKLNGGKMDTALWTGVPASVLLSEAGVPVGGESETTAGQSSVEDDSACCVFLRAEDDYYQEFPLAAMEDALLAFKMNGSPLPNGHGAPVRVLVPGHWGEINVKWLSEIEVLTTEKQGYWEKRGWHGTGPVNTVAKLHGVEKDGSTVMVGGHAYAGTRGISAVEVSTDGGDTWSEATLSDPLPDRVPADADIAGDDPSLTDGEATDASRMWRYEYEADGKHEVVVRAIEADGTVQPRKEGDGKPFPSGATGWVSKTVRI
jgi:DMSO/TMAO reductase YedYZ molybdopterin-dependent catalytic subunit